MKPEKRQDREGVNWVKVRKRLERAIAATEEAAHVTPERARVLMDERARVLARPVEQTTADGLQLEVVVFRLGDERYGIEARHVREVARLTDLTPVPGGPDFLAGVTTLRGQILALIDLRPFLGVSSRGLTDLSWVLVLGDNRDEFGVLADAATEVVALPPERVSEPSGPIGGIARTYVRGVTDDALIVLDGDVLLQDPRLLIEQ